MGLRLLLLASIIVMGGGLAVWSSLSPSETESTQFEAHEYAVFRSGYDRLRVQKPEKRVEHFRSLLEATETAKLTPGMAETLAEFCKSIAASPEEAEIVQAEARLVLNRLEARFTNRAPASESEAK